MIITTQRPRKNAQMYHSYNMYNAGDTDIRKSWDTPSTVFSLVHNESKTLKQQEYFVLINFLMKIKMHHRDELISRRDKATRMFPKPGEKRRQTPMRLYSPIKHSISRGKQSFTPVIFLSTIEKIHLSSRVLSYKSKAASGRPTCAAAILAYTHTRWPAWVELENERLQHAACSAHLLPRLRARARSRWAARVSYLRAYYDRGFFSIINNYPGIL